jgi:ABC-type uncharacterized transport system fused permease/ATPase subunit
MNSQYELILKMMNQRFDRLEEKVDCLQSYKWRMTGFSAAIVFVFSVVSFLIQYILR